MDSIDERAEKLGVESKAKSVFSDLANAAVADPALRGFIGRIFEDAEEAPSYAMLNQDLVGDPGLASVIVPYISKAGKAHKRTFSEYLSGKESGDVGKSRTEVRADAYPVQYIDTSFTLMDETVKQIASLSKSAGGISVSFLERQMRVAVDEVRKAVNDHVFSGFNGQFAAAKAYAAASTTSKTWSDADTTGTDIYGDILKAIGVLVGNGTMKPNTLVMEPKAYPLLGKIVGTNGSHTVIGVVDDLVRRLGVSGGVRVVLSTAVTSDRFCILDANPRNMFVGFTENVSVSRVAYGTKSLTQDVYAKTIGFAPTVKGAGVAIDTTA